jgi:hypothetical protein
MAFSLQGIIFLMNLTRWLFPVGGLLLLLVACQPLVSLEGSEAAQGVNLIRVPLNATPTHTPFQPVANTPTVTPTATPTQTPTATPTLTPTVTNTPQPLPEVFVGAGDISTCGTDGDDHTSELLASIPGTIYTLGDNSNDRGEPGEFSDCFGNAWGRYTDRLFPVPGNHDYAYDGGSSYYDYFGSRAGEYGKGYYSHEVGAWHIIAINSVINEGVGSEQMQWLQADLAGHANRCSLAYWHYPRWSSGEVGNMDEMAPVIQLLYDYGVDVVLSAHDHIYERFAPQNPAGQLDLAWGIREFIVGTGGASHHRFGEIKANSEVRDNSSFGVLKLELYAEGYTWEFIPVRGDPFSDFGSDICH